MSVSPECLVQYISNLTPVARKTLENQAQIQGIAFEDYLLKNWDLLNPGAGSVAPEETKAVAKPVKKEKTQQLAYVAKPFVVCSMPHSAPKVTHYVRRNGKAFLRMNAVSCTDPSGKEKNYGLPYGRDRHFTYWLRTKATQLGTRKIPFPGVKQVLAEMGYTKTGKNADWLKEAILKCHNTLIYYVEGDPLNGGTSRGELIIPTINLQFEEAGFDATKESFIEVGQHFFEFADVPIDLNIIQKLGRHYMAMDLYMLLRLRLHNVKAGSQEIIFPFLELRKHFGVPDDMPAFKFKQDLSEAISKLKKVGFEILPQLSGTNIVIPRKRPARIAK